MAEYDVSLNGSSDMSRGIEILFKNFKNFVKKELTNVLAWRLAKSVELSLNGVLSRGGEIVDVSDTNNSNYWNMTLLSDPVFTPNFVAFVLDGSFHSSNSIQKKVEKTQDFPLMPLFVGDPQDTKVQFFISEMALNMAMLTFYENGGFIKGHRVSRGSTYVKTFIPNYEEVYGSGSDVFLLVEALSPPVVSISQGISTVAGEFSLRL